MKIFDLLRFSFGNLWRRKGRTALTAIGVILGTCLIVVAISLSLAMNLQVEAMLQSWGDLTKITIYNYSWNMNETQAPPLDDAMLDTMKKYENVVAVTPQYRPQNLDARITAGKQDRYSSYMYDCMGMYPEAIENMGYQLVSGRFLTREDVGSKKKIPVMISQNYGYQFEDTKKKEGNPKRYVYEGQTDAQGNEVPPFVDVSKDKMTLKLNVDYDEVTQKYKTLDYELEVVGILNVDYSKEFYGGIVMTTDAAKMLENDFKKAAKITGSNTDSQNGYETVFVKVDDMDNVPAVEKAIQDLGYETSSMSQQREEMQGQVGSIRNILLIMAVFAMFTAALNIVNTMAMSVTERTREIGVMKVLGCQLSRIRSMFIVEAATIGFIGGVIGILVSLAISAVLNNFSAIMAALGLAGKIDLGSIFGMGYVSEMGEPMAVSVIPFWLVLLGMVFAVGVGLLAGIFPANRAVKISALEAIRHE